MDDLLTIAEVAALVGVSPATIRSYRHTGPQRGARLPEADIVLGRTPAWKRSTIERWLASRPGQGARTDLAS